MNELSELAALALKQQDLEKQIVDLENSLSHVKSLLREVQEDQIPALMLSIGMGSFTLTDGAKISVKDEVYASIPKDRYSTAMQWLRDHDCDGIIKSQVAVDFGKGEDQTAQEVLDALRSLGVSAQLKENVHPMTLKAFVKEQLNAGTNLPMELFGATVVKRSIIQSPKD